MRLFVELIIRCIHLIAAIIWFGGVVFSTLIATPIIRQNLPSQNLLEIHNRFRHWIRFMINILLLTGGIVIFIVAWNNDMQLSSQYMIFAAAKLTAFGLMALFWGLHSSFYRKHLEATQPDNQADVPLRINILGHLALFSGLIVFIFALLLRD